MKTRVCPQIQCGMRPNRESERRAGHAWIVPCRAKLCRPVCIAALSILLLLCLSACGSGSSESGEAASALPGDSAPAARPAPTEAPVLLTPSPAVSAPDGEETLAAQPTESLPEPVYPSLSEGGFGEIMDYLSGASDVIPGPYAEADRERLIAQALEQGILLSFDPEGAMILADPQDPAAAMTLYPDGSYEGTDGSGKFFAVDYRWPDNALSQLLPTTDLPVLVAYTRDNSLTVYFENASYDELAAYSQSLWDAGFTEEPMEQAEEGVFAFYGVNEQGWAASVVYQSVGLATPFAGVSLALEEEEHQRSLGVSAAWPQTGPLSALPAPAGGQEYLLLQQDGEEQMAILFHAKPSDYDLYHAALLEAGYTKVIEEAPHYSEIADKEGVSAIISYYEGTILISIGMESGD